MKIVTTRRISQIFFFVLFIWFCVVSTLGESWWQLRGWPVNWFLQLDPLVAIGTMLTTHTLYWPLLWALVTVVLTILLGRFFCSWVCPFGSLHHFVGFLAHHKSPLKQKLELNKYRKGQVVKYFVLIVLLLLAAFPSVGASLQTGLLDPIPLINRSVSLIILAIADRATNLVSVSERFYTGAWAILLIFAATVFLNILVPRFYCRFICPLGALFGLLSRFSIWRIGKTAEPCSNCMACERNCEGGCEPSGNIKISECVMCLNCLDDCKDEMVGYRTKVSKAGESYPDISRRGFMASIVGSVFVLPAIRLGGQVDGNWDSRIIRPPGALFEEDFLKRCIKCGQCMRVCPTNVIQPGSLQGGLENLWTPVLNNRIGTSGCQLNCVACGHICPTAAIRNITLDEKLGKGEFKETGPVKLGTAFVDRNRCLPWAMTKPCIVCEENCPVSPKAIYTKEEFEQIRNGVLTIEKIIGNTVETSEKIEANKFSTGDYYCIIEGRRLEQIAANTENTITIKKSKFEAMSDSAQTLEIRVRLQRPYVDIEKCIGCGICEHECPVSGKRAVRVSGEGQTRNPDRSLLLKQIKGGA